MRGRNIPERQEAPVKPEDPFSQAGQLLGALLKELDEQGQGRLLRQLIVIESGSIAAHTAPLPLDGATHAGVVLKAWACQMGEPGSELSGLTCLSVRNELLNRKGSPIRHLRW